MSSCAVCGRQLSKEDAVLCQVHRIEKERKEWAIRLRSIDDLVLHLRDQEHLTQEEIGQRLGVSRARAGQRIKQARRRLALR